MPNLTGWTLQGTDQDKFNLASFDGKGYHPAAWHEHWIDLDSIVEKLEGWESVQF